MRTRWPKIAALGVTAAGATALLLTATGATGAFFTDTHPGTISGTTGAITINTTDTNLAFSDMLPGVPQSKAVSYTNSSGDNAEDVYVVFPNGSALGALNNLGTYGSVTVSSDGGAYFSSSNLNDNATSCGPFSSTGCNPLPSVIKLQNSLAPGATGTMTFSFNYASKLTSGPNNEFENAPFNLYPVVGEVWSDTANIGTDCSSAAPLTKTPASDTNGHGDLVGAIGGTQCVGLPYQIVATQVGATPPSP